MVGHYYEDTVSDRVTTRKPPLIEIDRTIGEAIEIMEKKETDYAIVMENDRPVSVLRQYQTYGERKDQTIADFAKTTELEKPNFVHQDLDWCKAVKRFEQSGLLIVIDRTPSYTKQPFPDEPPIIRGTVDIKYANMK